VKSSSIALVICFFGAPPVASSGAYLFCWDSNSIILGGGLGLTAGSLLGGGLDFELYLRLAMTCSSCPIFRPRFCCVLMLMASIAGAGAAGGCGGGGGCGFEGGAILFDLLRPLLLIAKT
jgi:hypothetical protein